MMTQEQTNPDSIVVCRRCKQSYSHQPRAVLSACPNCGASPLPLRHHLRHNGLAAVLAVLALIVLVVGMVLPFISMTKLGISRIYSLIGGIVELFHSGNVFIGGVLLLFSVIFPIVKLIMLLVATSSLVSISQAARHRIHVVAVFTGKYSLLDVLVVAVTIILVKFGSLAEVRAQPGTILFCVGVLLSMAAGLCVNFDDDVAEAQP